MKYAHLPIDRFQVQKTKIVGNSILQILGLNVLVSVNTLGGISITIYIIQDTFVAKPNGHYLIWPNSVLYRDMIEIAFDVIRN